MIEKKEFTIVVCDLNHEAFVIYVAALNISPNNEIHSSKKAQITYLKANKTPTKVPSEYAYFKNIFSPKLAIELLDHIAINNYTIKLVNN